MSGSGHGGILCAGSIVFDILVKSVEALHFGTTAFLESIEYRVGGNAANTSRALAILGVPVRIVGAVGPDDAATMVLDKLRACGVDTQSVMRMDLSTATSVALINTHGDRQFLHRLGTSGVVFADLPHLTQTCAAGSRIFTWAAFSLCRISEGMHISCCRMRNARVFPLRSTQTGIHRENG